MKTKVMFFTGFVIIVAILANINHEEKTEFKNLLQNMNKKRIFEACMNEKDAKNEFVDEVKILKNDIDNFIKDNNLDVSIYYEDLTTNLTYTYKENKVWYGCSLIKLVEAIYLINEAIDGKIDLDKETITYNSKWSSYASENFRKRKIGEKISLRDLITYSITVSDNAAHFMLQEYIGVENLKAYGNALGAKDILTHTGSTYGNNSAHDTNIYLQEVYKIINENPEYGAFLKNIMDNDYYNYLTTDENKIYHKYGQCNNEFNDIVFI